MTIQYQKQSTQIGMARVKLPFMEKLGFQLLDQSDLTTARAIFSLWQASYRVEGELLGMDDFPPLRRTCDAIVRSDGQFYGIYRMNELVALTEILVQAAPIADISAFVVAPSAFRQGLGRRLLNEIMTLLAPDYTEITVSTAVANQPAIRLYEGSGFVVNQRWQQANGLAMVTLHWSCANADSSRRLDSRA